LWGAAGTSDEERTSDPAVRPAAAATPAPQALDARRPATVEVPARGSRSQAALPV